MRPSWSSFSSVIRAISRRTPSNPERITALGVSSMMKSTPVRCSSARMLRPSRPMMRPFMSSAGSCTTDTVVSAAWPAASRCMTTERMLRTRRSASRLVSSSIWRTNFAPSWRTWSVSSLSRICLACDALMFATRSSSRTWRSRTFPISSSRACSRRSRSARPLSRESSASSLVINCSSMRTTSARRSFRSLSIGSAPAGPGALPRGAVCGADPMLGSRRARSMAAATMPARSPTATTTAAITMSIASSPQRAGPWPVPLSHPRYGAADRTGRARAEGRA